jgi:hypothetical protein
MALSPWRFLGSLFFPRVRRRTWGAVGAALAVFLLGLACATGSTGASPFPSAVAAPPSPVHADGGQRPPRTKPDRICEFTDVAKIVAVGDLHGAYKEFVEILKGTEIVAETDGELHWAAGKTHLVQMGDIIDRGKEPKKIFDLISMLEGEALAAGGRVHMLIGNHEELNIMGLSLDVPGGVSIEQFKDFLPDRYRAAKEKEFQRTAGPGADTGPYWKQLISDPDAQAEYYREFNYSYGRWIARHNAVVKINDVVFVHGGLSESFSTYPCGRLNYLLTTELERYIRGDTNFVPRIVHNERGPLWYRELAIPENEDILKDEVDRILNNLGARAMVVAHTPSLASISLLHLDRFGGKVWVIDTGIWMESGGALSALIIENGNIRVWPKDDITGRSPSRK